MVLRLLWELRIIVSGVLGFIRKTFIFLVLAAVVLLGHLADQLDNNE